MKGILLIILAVFLQACAIGDAGRSAEDIFLQQLDEQRDAGDHFIHIEIRQYHHDKLVLEGYEKIWHKENEQGIYERSEHRMGESSKMKTVYKPEKYVTYTPEDQRATYRKEVEYARENTSMSELQNQVESYQETHEIVVVGEEEYLGREIYMLEFLPAAEDQEHVEMWVDQETWTILKEVRAYEESGMKLETKVVEFDPSPEFAEGLFHLDVDDDVEWENLDDVVEEESVSDDQNKEVISVEDAEDILGGSYSSLSLEQVDRQLEEERTMKEAQYVDAIVKTVNYAYHWNEEPYMELTIRVNFEPLQKEEDMPGRQAVEIRGEPGVAVETGSGTINYLLWREGDLAYHLLSRHPDMDIAELLAYAEMME